MYGTFIKRRLQFLIQKQTGEFNESDLKVYFITYCFKCVCEQFCIFTANTDMACMSTDHTNSSFCELFWNCIIASAVVLFTRLGIPLLQLRCTLPSQTYYSFPSQKTWESIRSINDLLRFLLAQWTFYYLEEPDLFLCTKWWCLP